MTASHFSAGNSSTGATCWMPALFTTMSNAPDIARRLRHHRRHFRGPRHVGGVVVDLDVVLGCELSDELVDQCLVAEADQHHVRSGGREGTRDTEPDPARIEPVTNATLPDRLTTPSASRGGTAEGASGIVIVPFGGALTDVSAQA